MLSWLNTLKNPLDRRWQCTQHQKQKRPYREGRQTRLKYDVKLTNSVGDIGDAPVTRRCQKAERIEHGEGTGERNCHSRHQGQQGSGEDGRTSPTP